MTKNELILNIAGKANFSQPEAKVFFEVFLSRLSEKMNPGDVFRFEDLGFFHRKNGIIKTGNIQMPSSDERISGGTINSNSVGLILFSPEETIGENLKGVHLFIIPESYPRFFKSDSDEDDLESYLNLSIDKPLINDERFEPPDSSGPQNKGGKLNALISGADKIISFLQLVTVKSSTEFYMKPGQQFDNSEADFLNKSEKELRDYSSARAEGMLKPILDISSARRSEDTAEREIRNVQKEEDVSGMRSLPWDFGRISFDRKVEYIREEANHGAKGNITGQTEAFEKEKRDEDIKAKESDESEKLTEKVIDEIISDEKAIDEIIKNEKEEIEKTEHFVRVRSFISEGLKDKKKPEPFRITEPQKDIATSKSSEDLKTGNEFVEVKAKLETSQFRKDLRKETNLKKDNQQTDIRAEKFASERDKYWRDREKSSFMPLLIFGAVIIIIFGLVYIYLNQGDIFSSELENITYSVKRPDNVKVIERKNDVAVTFPYPKPGNYSGITGVDPIVFAGMNVNTSEQKVIEESSTPLKNKEKNKLETVSTTKEINKPEQIKKETPKTVDNEQKNKNNSSKTFGSMGGNVYKYKDYYVVQVASYASYDIADGQAKRFKEKGYNAFVEIAEIPGKGTWYRVRVGDFTSLKQAEDFAAKNSIH